MVKTRANPEAWVTRRSHTRPHRITNPNRKTPTMPLTRDQAQHIAELACTIRPEWTVTDTLRGLHPLGKHPSDLATLAWAVIRAAATVPTPADLPWNSPAWGLDRPPEDLEQLNPRQLARDAVRRSQEAAQPDEVPSEVAAMPGVESAHQPHHPDSPSVPTAIRDGRANPCPDCGRDLDQDVAPGDPDKPACPRADRHPLPGTLPHHAGHPDHTANHHHAYPWRRGMTPEERRRSAQQDAGKCLDPYWEGCPAGTAWLSSYCREPAGHHDAHRGPDLDDGTTTPVTWQRTRGPAPIDYCDHNHDDNGDPMTPTNQEQTP